MPRGGKPNAALCRMAQTTDPKLDQLKQKYQSVLNLIEQQGLVRLQNLHVQDGKLFLRGVASSQEAKNRVWDQIKLVDSSYSDLIADISVEESGARTQSAGAAIGSAGQIRTYTVMPGDTLSKISKHFYGDSNQYTRIFEANRDKLTDADKIRPGQELVIPQ